MKKMLGLLALALLVSLPGCGCCKSKGKKEESRAKTTKQMRQRDAEMMDDADELNEDADIANSRVTRNRKRKPQEASDARRKKAAIDADYKNRTQKAKYKKDAAERNLAVRETTLDN